MQFKCMGLLVEDEVWFNILVQVAAPVCGLLAVSGGCTSACILSHFQGYGSASISLPFAL